MPELYFSKALGLEGKVNVKNIGEWDAYYYKFPPGAQCDIEAYAHFQASCQSGDARVWNTWYAGHRNTYLQGLCIEGWRIPNLDLENCHI